MVQSKRFDVGQLRVELIKFYKWQYGKGNPPVELAYVPACRSRSGLGHQCHLYDGHSTRHRHFADYIIGTMVEWD